MSASSIWNISEVEFPTNGSPRQKLAFALKYAALAPAQNGWQPWHFRMTDTYLELLIKNKPTLEAIDPDKRELIIGCGAALLYLKLALKHFGCLGRVALFPDLGEPTLVARVHLGFCRERDEREKLLFEAMNHADDSPLGTTTVSEAMLALLSQAAAGERGWLDFTQSETSRRYVMKITLAAKQPAPDFSTEEWDSRWRLQSSASGSRRTDAFNWEIKPVRELSVAATLAVVKTKTDDKHGWLEAGQTMARTVLQARALGLSWSFFDPVRCRETRAALRTGVGHKGFAQVILQFGPLMDAETIPVAVSSAVARLR